MIRKLTSPNTFHQENYFEDMQDKKFYKPCTYFHFVLLEEPNEINIVSYKNPLYKSSYPNVILTSSNLLWQSTLYMAK